MNVGRRVEHEIARIHLSFLASKGVKDVDLADLMVHEQENTSNVYDEEEVDSLQAYMMANVE